MPGYVLQQGFGNRMATLASKSFGQQMQKDFFAFECLDTDNIEGENNGMHADGSNLDRKQRKYRFLNCKHVQCNRRPFLTGFKSCLVK